MRFKKPKVTDIIFLIVVAVLIIPKTRKPIQVFVNKAVAAVISPSKIQEEKQEAISTYDWRLKDSQGKNFNFEQTKGKIVLVNFWATWCPPCIAEMPSLQELYNDYQDKIEFVFVSSEPFKDINSFIEKNKYNFKVYKPVSNYNEIFKVNGIPRTFLIDKKGKIVIDKTGAANWNSEKVRNTINELIQQ
ncbi:TlpA family protein disulfide reductase [Seonamhaeicola maritimus]|uniref:TlpA family protein disulfide reductase n=1 Tax=Seonamhaeicola maritimus TaxID=2591822 RepID=A0A5C7GLS4_9FLAO|nr:TlpA disulfide reductase family protein [Seonamhaeicola maritimus]TXG39215.1 TlpA family protein disulfide reductase [Seonamhaeicola maritimus]